MAWPGAPELGLHGHRHRARRSTRRSAARSTPATRPAARRSRPGPAPPAARPTRSAIDEPRRDRLLGRRRASTPTPSPTPSPRTTTDLEHLDSARDPRRATAERAAPRRGARGHHAPGGHERCGRGRGRAEAPSVGTRALAVSVPPDPVPIDAGAELEDAHPRRQPEQHARQGHDREPVALAGQQRQGHASASGPTRAGTTLVAAFRQASLTIPAQSYVERPADGPGSGDSSPRPVLRRVPRHPGRDLRRLAAGDQPDRLVRHGRRPGPARAQADGAVQRPEPRPRLTRHRHAAHRERRPDGGALLGRERHDVVARRLVRAAASRRLAAAEQPVALLQRQRRSRRGPSAW